MSQPGQLGGQAPTLDSLLRQFQQIQRDLGARVTANMLQELATSLVDAQVYSVYKHNVVIVQQHGDPYPNNPADEIFATINVTIPDGYTQVQLTAYALATFISRYHITADGAYYSDSFEVAVVINRVNPTVQPFQSGVEGHACSLSMTAQATLTGLSAGDVIPVEGLAVAGAQSTQADSDVALIVSALFLK